MHFIDISVPASFGIILGFSINEGANPAPSSPPKMFHEYNIQNDSYNNININNIENVFMT